MCFTSSVHHWLFKAIHWVGSSWFAALLLALPVQSAIAQTPVTLHVGGQYAADNPSGLTPGQTWGTAFLWLQDALLISALI